MPSSDDFPRTPPRSDYTNTTQGTFSENPTPGRRNRPPGPPGQSHFSSSSSNEWYPNPVAQERPAFTPDAPPSGGPGVGPLPGSGMSRQSYGSPPGFTSSPPDPRRPESRESTFSDRPESPSERRVARPSNIDQATWDSLAPHQRFNAVPRFRAQSARSRGRAGQSRRGRGGAGPSSQPWAAYGMTQEAYNYMRSLPEDQRAAYLDYWTIGGSSRGASSLSGRGGPRRG